MRGLLLLFAFSIFVSTNCTYTIKVKDGQTAHELKQYSVAIPMLKKDFEREKTRSGKGPIAYRIADSYDHLSMPDEALKWYNIAYQNNYGPEALKGSAYQLKKLEKYTEARSAFKELGIEIGSPYEYRKELTACDVAAGWKEEYGQKSWSLESLTFNGSRNEFSPTLFEDGRIVFTSDRAQSKGDDPYSWTGNRYMDLFIVEPQGASPQAFDQGLNSEGHEGTICFNPEFSEAFFVKTLPPGKDNGDVFCKIYSVNRTGDTWSEPRPLPFQRDNINYLHPVLSPDGKTLYFACNDPEGWGGYDLYESSKSLVTENGWNEPKILSRNVNTSGNEMFPTVFRDTLFFASDGHTGMGGLDIFKTHRLGKRSWAPAQNLKAPINSGSDDFGYLVVQYNADSKEENDLIQSGYLTSNRPGGNGSDDIYRFEQRVLPPEPPKQDTTPEKPPVVAELWLNIYVLEKIFSTPDDPNSTVLGRKPLGGASLEMNLDGKTRNLEEVETGHYRIKLTGDKDYLFLAGKEGYLKNTNSFSSVGLRPGANSQEFELEIVLDKIFFNREITLENIYYDFDKWDIRSDAEPTLNQLAEMLTQNPGIRIELGSHTDCRGNDSYNQNLSQKRAQSAVNYLINRGVETNRLQAQGYGESLPAEDCACNRCSESQHQTNRRTTFKIVE